MKTFEAKVLFRFEIIINVLNKLNNSGELVSIALLLAISYTSTAMSF